MENAKVSALSIASMLFTELIILAAIFAGYKLFKRERRDFIVLALYGAVGFLLMQLIVRVPLLQWLNGFSWYADFAKNSFVLYALFLGLTAALFETVGRLLVFKVFARNDTSFETTAAFGLGHGAFEAIALVSLSYINYISYSAMINGGVFEATMLQGGADAATIESVVAVLTGTPWTTFLVAGIERVFTMTFHVAMTLLLIYYIRRKKGVIGFLLVVAAHTLLDFGSVMLSNYLSIWAAEGYALIVAALSAYLIVKLKKRFTYEDGKATEAENESAEIKKSDGQGE